MASEELRDWCQIHGGKIQETLQEDNDIVTEGCVVEIGNDFATVVTQEGVVGEYEVQFGEFGRGRGKSRHHRETVLRPHVTFDVDSLEGHSVTNMMSFQSDEVHEVQVPTNYDF
jgi:hypothetical protein